MDIKQVKERLGVFIYKSKLSGRELSGRIGKSPQYVLKLLNGDINISVDALLQILEVLEVPVLEFFYDSPDDFKADMELLALFKTMSAKQKTNLINLIKER